MCKSGSKVLGDSCDLDTECSPSLSCQESRCLVRGFTLNASTWIALIIGCIIAVATLVLGILCCKCIGSGTSVSSSGSAGVGVFGVKTDLKKVLDEISELRESQTQPLLNRGSGP